MVAVRQNGCALDHASEDLKADREVVEAAIEQNGLALEYASDALKNDTDVQVAAGQQVC